MINIILILYYSNVNVLRNDNNVAHVKSKRIETSICSIINIKLSKPIFGLPMLILIVLHKLINNWGGQWAMFIFMFCIYYFPLKWIVLILLWKFYKFPEKMLAMLTSL